MLITKMVRLKWHPSIREYYKSKGYAYTRHGDELEVKVEDLPNGSHVSVCVECDECGVKSTVVKWQNYKRYIHEDGKYYCHKCALDLFGKEKVRITKLEKGKTFEQWCYEELSKENARDLLLRWDQEKNLLSPKEVTFGSNGTNGKGYWFKCLDHPEHESEQKFIFNFTRHKGSMGCAQCSSIAVTRPDLAKFFVNKEDAVRRMKNSKKIVPIKCPICGYEKQKAIYDFVHNGFGCPKCSDGVSYPEKFILSVLEQLNVVFKPQLTRTTLEWCNCYRYDFYVDNSIIIEAHGTQHYKETIGVNWTKLEDVQNNDKEKEQLANENGIKNYIILDCRYSKMEWIKDSIMGSDLPRLLQFNESDINWMECNEHAYSSLAKKACDLWNAGVKDRGKMCEILNISRRPLILYLKLGAERGWCDYDPKEESKIALDLRVEKRKMKVTCITTGEVFDSQLEARTKYNISEGNISKCCSGSSKHAGRHPETGKKLVWERTELFA